MIVLCCIHTFDHGRHKFRSSKILLFVHNAFAAKQDGGNNIRGTMFDDPTPGFCRSFLLICITATNDVADFDMQGWVVA